MIGTANTVRRDCPPSHRFDLGRSSSPTNTVASSANRMPALISDARTGNNCGGHTAGRLAAQAQLGRTGCAIQSTSNPRSTVPTATAGERVAPTVWMGIEPDYRSSTTAARRLRRSILRDNVNQSRSGFPLWEYPPPSLGLLDWLCHSVKETRTRRGLAPVEWTPHKKECSHGNDTQGVHSRVQRRGREAGCQHRQRASFASSRGGLKIIRRPSLRK